MRAQIFIPRLWRCVDQMIFTRERSNFSKGAAKEMALDVGKWCKQFEVVVLLLVGYLSTSALSCPQGCECGQDSQMKYAECYDLNSVKSIPADIPTDTTAL